MVLNYIGSKKSLLPFIDDVVKGLAADGTFCDPFAGTGSVGNFFKNRFTVTSNDSEYYSYIINYATLKCDYTVRLGEYLDTLNNTNGVTGFVTQNYSPVGDRMFFTTENAQKIDGIRVRLDSMVASGEITEDEYTYMLACLLEAADKVANIACVYGSFLKKFKGSAKRGLVLVPIHTDVQTPGHNVYNSDIIDFFKTAGSGRPYDIVYLDPPYNHRQYSTNYFVLNYIANYKKVDLKGKTGIPPDCFKSKFSSKTLARNEFETLIGLIDSKYILLSYNNEGIISSTDIVNVLQKKGTVTVHTKKYKKFKAQQSVKEQYVTEYLYVCTVKTLPFVRPALSPPDTRPTE